MSQGLLEVIAVDVEDARRAVAGGADRIELVSAMEHAGFCPAPETVAAVRAAVDVPVRVMLRTNAGFTIGGRAGTAEIVDAAHRLLHAGAEEFVLGWLDDKGDVDLPALDLVRGILDGHPVTFHKAVDHVRNRDEAFDQIRFVPGVDTVLTGGGTAPAGQGAARLALEAGREAALGDMGLKLLVGGGLRLADVPKLQQAGLRDFHVGSAVRAGGDWAGSVDPALVAQWRAAVDG